MPASASSRILSTLRAERVTAGAPALPELVGLVERTLDAAAQDRADATLGRLIEAAKQGNALRDDVTAEDFYLLLDTAPTGADRRRSGDAAPLAGPDDRRTDRPPVAATHRGNGSAVLSTGGLRAARVR